MPRYGPSKGQVWTQYGPRYGHVDFYAQRAVQTIQNTTMSIESNSGKNSVSQPIKEPKTLGQLQGLQGPSGFR